MRRGPGAALLTGLLAIGLFSSPAGGVAGFGDIASDRFYTEAVQWMVLHDITTGTSATCFSPDDPVTRGQAAAFLWRMEGFPDPGPPHAFGDVTKSWQQDPVSWMFNNEITTGTSSTTYSPDQVLNRGQLAALLYRLEGNPPVGAPHPFSDVVLDWQQDPVTWMFWQEITTGTTPSTFSPDDPVTRGQVAAFFHRYKGSPAVPIDLTHPSVPACAGQVPAPEDADPDPDPWILILNPTYAPLDDGLAHTVASAINPGRFADLFEDLPSGRTLEIRVSGPLETALEGLPSSGPLCVFIRDVILGLPEPTFDVSADTAIAGWESDNADSLVLELATTTPGVQPAQVVVDEWQDDGADSVLNILEQGDFFMSLYGLSTGPGDPVDEFHGWLFRPVCD